jgi:hypothetical protein
LPHAAVAVEVAGADSVGVEAGAGTVAVEADSVAARLPEDSPARGALPHDRPAAADTGAGADTAAPA